ncbi:phage tail assembly chaperone [Variovorax ginsengisoli]|uniref:Phage tail assembly chaperone n=1 Tax=Variovorax ginsengisoli TaxID=363844 RepID=A0ABT8RZ77_9BURK|nr:phage tail assembly chaperone [Variovorax ginsengisoli]MDN8612799.1 phage tail assembly chaperone [Variovorax ginsengisoli]MDO1531969.1 phage tail assembly chaperone [Variovorax ginsengisoli]
MEHEPEHAGRRDLLAGQPALHQVLIGRMFKLKADPTFSAKVAIPVAGGASVEVPFTFKHRTKKQFADWLESLEERRKARAGENLDLEIVLEVIAGWGIDETFSNENVEILLEERIGAAVAIRDKYIDELTKQREKN